MVSISITMTGTVNMLRLCVGSTVQMQQQVQNYWHHIESKQKMKSEVDRIKHSVDLEVSPQEMQLLSDRFQ